jgi:asparagine synthase (glutamine-hydrolysing)
MTREHSPADLLDQTLRVKLDLTDFAADSYRDGLAEVPYLPGQEGLERRMREICYLHLTRFLPELLDRKDRMSMAVGLEVRVPFCDHRLVEYVFNTPWAMKTYDRREKSLLRGAVTDLLPEPILRRVKSPYPATQDAEYERVLRKRVGEVARDDRAPVAPLLDAELVKRAVEEPVAKTTTMTRQALEMVIDLNVWLQMYGVRLEL